MHEILEMRKYVICNDSLRNVIKDGKKIGFQLNLRIPEYRGLPLALIGGILLKIDGKQIPEDQISITTEGQTFKWNEISTVRSVYWLFEEPAVITISNGVGLCDGVHEVGAFVELRISYMPAGIFTGEYKKMEVSNAD